MCALARKCAWQVLLELREPVLELAFEVVPQHRAVARAIFDLPRLDTLRAPIVRVGAELFLNLCNFAVEAVQGRTDTVIRLAIHRARATLCDASKRMFHFTGRAEAPNDPKLSDWRSGRDACVVVARRRWKQAA